MALGFEQDTTLEIEILGYALDHSIHLTGRLPIIGIVHIGSSVFVSSQELSAMRQPGFIDIEQRNRHATRSHQSSQGHAHGAGSHYHATGLVLHAKLLAVSASTAKERNHLLLIEHMYAMHTC